MKNLPLRSPNIRKRHVSEATGPCLSAAAAALGQSTSASAMVCHMQNSGKAAVAVVLLLATTTSGAVIGIDFGARFLKVRSLCAARHRQPLHLHLARQGSSAAACWCSQSFGHVGGSSSRDRAICSAFAKYCSVYDWPIGRPLSVCRGRFGCPALDCGRDAHTVRAVPHAWQVGIIRPGTGIEMVLNEATQRKSSSSAGFTALEERVYGNEAQNMLGKVPERIFIMSKLLLGQTLDSEAIHDFKR